MRCGQPAASYKSSGVRKPQFGVTMKKLKLKVVFDGKKFAFDWLAWRKNRGRFHEVFL